jgi:hypothetical protein
MKYPLYLFPFLGVLMFAASNSATDALAELSRLRGQVESNQLVNAIRILPSIHRFLYGKAGLGNCRPDPRLAKTLAKPSITTELIASVQKAIEQSNYELGCKDAMILGISLQKQLYNLPPESRLIQYENALPGSGQDLASVDQLMWANLDAGKLTRAEDLARDIESRTRSLDRRLQPDYFQHSARTVLGLVRLRSLSPSIGDAAQYLESSAEVEPSEMLLGSLPAVRLADALWQAGRRDAVVTYLAKIRQFAWRSNKAQVDQWYEAATQGQRPEFFPPGSAHLGR